jgi:hypothetical protein
MLARKIREKALSDSLSTFITFIREFFSKLLKGFLQPAFANTNKKSFWTPTCGGLINVEIGRWMRSLGLIPWIDGDPPEFELRQIGPSIFEVRLAP